MSETSVKTSKRMRYSNAVASGLALVLLIFAGATLALGKNPLEDVPYHIVVATSSLIFSGVLFAWVLSAKRQWIGIETVNLLVGVVAALIAISAFAQEIERRSTVSAPTARAK